MSTPALVLQFTEEAERQAERGHRVAALRLAALALDFGGTSDAVFWRILGVRDAALANAPGADSGVVGVVVEPGTLSLPDLSADPNPSGRTPTIFGSVPAESPFGDDGATIYARRPRAGTKTGAAARKVTLLHPTDDFLGREESALRFPYVLAALLLLAGISIAAIDPLTVGRVAYRFGWDGGAIYLANRAAGSLPASAEAHATLGEWYMNDESYELATVHYRRAAQMGLSWDRIPEILTRLRQAGQVDGSADLLIAAFGAGAPPEAWPVIIQELRLLGRGAEADNMREIVQSKRSIRRPKESEPAAQPPN